MPCVLIIDDNSSVLQALEFFFQSEGYAVLGAPNGREGLRMAAENPVDIVLLDIEMPEMSGIAVCGAAAFAGRHDDRAPDPGSGDPGSRLGRGPGAGQAL